jgi:HAD superfamily hydrolase (TIGR01509 family)
VKSDACADTLLLPMKFQPKCILSDCDGVIVDSEVIAEAVVVEVLGEVFGLENVAREIEGNFGVRVVDILSCLERKHGRGLDASARRLILQDIDYRTASAAPAVAGVRAAYESCRLPLAIVSNSSPQRIRISVGRAGLGELVGAHMYSGDEVPRPKPAPDVYLKAAERLGFDPADCLVIEDSVAGVSAAVAASMKVAGFLGGSHIKPDHGARLRAAGAVVVFHHFGELAALLGD